VPGDRLTGSDKRGLLLWIVLGVIGAVFAYRFYFRAFPEASVDFRVSRSEALKRASDFVGRLGENVSGYRSAIIFNVDDDAKTYLERELGLQEANQLMSSQLNIWYWDVRFFKPQQEEEFHVRINPQGQIVGYEHVIPEAQAGASLDRSAAQTATEKFLTSGVGVDLSGWQFLPEEADSKKRPNRTDWFFTWEKRGFRAKDAPYRMRASLQGERPGATSEYLQVPEAWKRSFARLRSGNDTLTLAFVVPYIFLLGIAVWLAFRLTRLGQTTWYAAIVVGAAAATLLFLQGVNDWPLWSASYDTRSSWESFIFTKLGLALVGAIATALTITLVLPAAEPLYRASQPDRLQLYSVLSLRGLRSKEFFSAAVVGLSMAAAHIGYVVGFYIVASNWFHAWAPQEINYEESVNTLFPWISGAAIGLLASTNEEFTFRLFAIPFFQRSTGSRWVAVILPAFLWSFLHSNYPQEPPYIRGIEIGIFGMVAGVVMLRWGIMATLIWHYTVDASLVGLFLVRSNSLYFKISGIVVAAAAVAPLLFAGVSYLARGGFEATEDLTNKEAPAPELSLTGVPAADKTETSAKKYEPLSAVLISVLAFCVLAGGVLAWRLKPAAIGDYLKLSIDRRVASERADESLRQRGIKPNLYHHATLLVDTMNPITNEFLRERVGIVGANAIYASKVPGALWSVRYFRDSEPEEYTVVLKPDGSLHSVHHIVAEAAAGASLSKEEAVSRAEKYLREEKKIDLGRWSLVEAKSDKRPKRIDHTLTWQENTPVDSSAGAADGSSEHAYARMELVVLGDEVTDFRTYIKIPDEFARQHEQGTLVRAILGRAIPIVVIAGLGIAALVIFLMNLRSEAARAVPWKRVSRWAVWGLIGYVLVFALGNTLQQFLNRYDTAVPLKTMYGVIGIGGFLGAIFSFGAIALLFGLAWYYGALAFGEDRVPGWAGMPAAYYRDALWIGIGSAAGLIGLESVLQRISQLWPTAHEEAIASIGTTFDAIVPAAAVFGTTLRQSLMYIGIIALIASFVAAKIRPLWMRALLFVLGTLVFVGGGWGGAADFVKQWIIQAIILAVIVAGIVRIMRLNVLGGFLAIAVISLVDAATELLSQPAGYYRANGYIVAVLLVLGLALPMLAWRMRVAAVTRA
jgi:Type II CAAX prenyl endopeptidase Rce1-like